MKAPVKNKRTARGATTVAPSWRTLLQAWLQHHRHSANSSLQQQKRAPAQFFLTAIVIGITLALPALFMLAIHNVQKLGEHWNGNPRLSVFLERKTAAEKITELQQQLRQHTAVNTITLITPEQGLADFEKDTNLSNTLALLDENPLPPLLTVELKNDTAPEAVETLQKKWQQLPQVDSVRVDFAWLQKLFHLMQLGKRIAVGLAVLLGMGALLSIGNTIRLALENRRTEIVVANLVGATDAFVRRPFLYSGMWFGLAGGAVAIILMEVGYYSIVEPTAQLAALYHSTFSLQGPTLLTLLSLMVSGVAIGILGAWLTAWYHLRTMRPQ
ncbi:MAG: permease-like cell division protein FtsX [Pseudomonadales bacterium]